MNAITRLRLLPLLVALAATALPARGQVFFPAGIDYLNYVPNVPGTPAGRLYVGDLFGNGNCHFRLDLPLGKAVTRVEMTSFGNFSGRIDEVIVTRLGGNVEYHNPGEFKLVDKHGNPCVSSARMESATRVEVGAESPHTIPVSNDASSFDVTCDGRFAVVVGGLDGVTPVPVSLVDLTLGEEVDTLLMSDRGNFVAACDDGSVLVLLNIAGVYTVRRLTIAEPGKLTDTGESLAYTGTASSGGYEKVFAVPGSKVGVALGKFGAPGITTFSIPGLQVLDSSPPVFNTQPSAAVSCAGDKIYLRTGSETHGEINGFTLDPVTGALGDMPFLTIDNVAEPGVAPFGDALALSRDGTRLIVPERPGLPTSPPTGRVTFFDTTTGERVGFFEPAGAEDNSQMLVATYSCCAELPVRAASTLLFKKGDAAPGAGGGVGKPPADALFSSFGVPAIDAFGQPAFAAKWTSATAGKGSGLFTDTASVAIVGGAVPGLGGPKFKTFADPLIDGGHVAFLATLGSVPKATSSAVLSDAPSGTLAVIARTGDAAPGADGTTFKSFSAIGLDGASVGFLAKLSGSKATDMGLWATDATHALTLLLREGQMIGSQTIKAIVSFKVGNGSPGQGRGWLLAPAAGTQTLALVTFTDKTQAVVTASIDGTITVLSQGGPGGVGGPDVSGANFASYGVPALNAAGHSAFLGTLAIGAGGVTKTNARGVFANFGTTVYAPIGRAGSMAGATGTTFVTLKDPVLASDDSLAFTATIKGGGIRGRAAKTLWAQGPGGATYLAAQGGANPPGTAGGAQWQDFTSLAVIAGHGPLFTATLVPVKGLIKPNTSGVWGADTDGVLQLYFRTGQTIDGKKLKSFKLLNATPGSLGATRSFNDTGLVAWLATFTDKTTAIVTTELPASP